MPIPKYAQATPPSQLVEFLCKTSCRQKRYGKVSKESWGSDNSRPAPDLWVTCLRCGGEQNDSSNWIRC